MGFFDEKVGKFISKKFLVWIIATVFLGLGWVINEQWYLITLVYLGVQGLIDNFKK
jgi:hypothetical protein